MPGTGVGTGTSPSDGSTTGAGTTGSTPSTSGAASSKVENFGGDAAGFRAIEAHRVWRPEAE
jgi:hypothetical protein